MSRHDGLVAFVVLAFLVASTPGVWVQSREEGAGPPGKEWTTIGGDWTGARYSTLAQITPQNIKTLGGAWTKKFDNGRSTRATPIVKDGLMFISAGALVEALNPKTGATVWSWRSDERKPGNLATTGGLVDAINARSAFPAPPGVAVGEELVFVGLTDGRVAALRQKTGELAWAQQIGEDPPVKGQSVSTAPTYANGVVYAGLANGDWALRGRVVALDARTGRKLWNFYTVPGPGEPGHETWPDARDPKWKDAWKQGGAGVWQPGTVDPQLGLVYYATGNAVPMFGGEARKGDNLYTASLLALDMKTGKLRWHYQVVHHDLWDADIAVPPMLFDRQVSGRPRKGIAAMRADGYLFLLDRETGKPLLPIEERKVTQDPYTNTSATQPFPVAADSLVPPCESWRDKIKPPFVLDCGGFTPPFLDKHNVVAPGVPVPSVRVTPMSYSPQTGYVYAQGTGSVGRARRISDDPWFRGGGGGGAPLPPAVGVLAAIDTRTNKIVWKKELSAAAMGNSGPVTTAGGLMFRGSGDGNVEAYDARTGDRLWQFQTGVTGLRGPAATYEIDGEQYLALATGTALWAFKLGGTVGPQPAPKGGPGGGFGGGGGGAGQETDEIETGTWVQSADRGVGRRMALDEHAFSPTRARVMAGTRVTFVNNGRLAHTVTAEDGSWSTGSIASAQSGYVTLAKPGTYWYVCKEHPWAMGQITAQ
jgi:PQQ-dependent dehydrogenase (methanol/ethanol family)